MNRIRLVLAATAVLLSSFAIAETFVLGTAEVTHDTHGYAIPAGEGAEEPRSYAAGAGAEVLHFGNDFHFAASASGSGVMDTAFDPDPSLGTSASLLVGVNAGAFTPYAGHVRFIQPVDQHRHAEGISVGSWYRASDALRVGAAARKGGSRTFGYSLGVLGGQRFAYSARLGYTPATGATNFAIGLGARF